MPVEVRSSQQRCRSRRRKTSPPWYGSRHPRTDLRNNAGKGLDAAGCYPLGSRVEHDLDQRYPILIAH